MRYGRTLARTDDGDIKVENGELVWLDGVDAAEEDLKNALETVRGEDPFDPDHGFDVFDAAGEPAAVVEREVRIALNSEDIVDSVDEVIVRDPDANRNREVEVSVSLVDGPGLNFDAEVTN